MRRVLVGFSTSEWWVSRVIRFFTRSTVSHAFLLLEGTEFGDMVLEAGWNGWRLSRRSRDFVGTTRIVELLEPPVTQADLQAAVQSSIDWLNESYNYEGLVGMAVVAAARWFGKKVRNPLRNSSSMFCSEGVVYVLQSTRLRVAGTPDPQSVSPDALRAYLRGVGSKSVPVTP